MKKYFCSALMMLILVLSANAQSNKFIIHAGGTLPITKFSGNSIDDWVLLNTASTPEKGCASAGLSGGLQFNIGISRGLDFTISLDAYYNSLNKKTLDDALITSVSKTPKYFNIPLMAGINYEFYINRNLEFYMAGRIWDSRCRFPDIRTGLQFTWSPQGHHEIWQRHIHLQQQTKNQSFIAKRWN